MSTPPCFLLDTNTFLDAMKRYYAFDLCPGYWTSLVDQHALGRVFSIDRVRDELDRVDDQLKQWVATVMPASHFAASDDDDTIDWFAKMMAWVQAQQQFFPHAKAAFANAADGWLIAHAKAHNMILVTHEAHAPDARRNVPMPNVCHAFGVVYVNTFDMLRTLKVQFT
jgi:hypothetical protein